MNARRVKTTTESDKPPPKAEPCEERKTLGRNLRIAREDEGLTQQQLAERAKVSQRMIWEIEARNRNVTLETVANLAKAFGLRGLDLLTPINWGKRD